MRIDRACRVGADDLNLGVALLEVARRADDGASGADARDEGGHFAVGVVPYLWAGRAIVRARIGRVGVLVRVARAGNLAREPRRDIAVALWRIGGHAVGADDDLRAQRPQQAAFFFRDFIGHHTDEMIAFDRGGQRQAGSSVAAGWLDDRAARLELARLLARLHQRKRRYGL